MLAIALVLGLGVVVLSAKLRRERDALAEAQRALREAESDKVHLFDLCQTMKKQARHQRERSGAISRKAARRGREIRRRERVDVQHAAIVSELCHVIDTTAKATAGLTQTVLERLGEVDATAERVQQHVAALSDG